ncbi:hypothetical protein SO694_00173016 [Aureococcus anophagefferens]|uniref:CHAT domain-containing protein n=1 Tax=Aureococcus anophagefferens TaxID=44056 RepID=A0ABR1FH97_AURAN
MDCDASTDDDDYYEWLRAPDSDEDVLPDDDDRAAPEPLEHRLSTGSATNEVAAIDSIAVEDSLSQTLHSPAARPTGAGRGRDVVWTPTPDAKPRRTNSGGSASLPRSRRSDGSSGSRGERREATRVMSRANERAWRKTSRHARLEFAMNFEGASAPLTLATAREDKSAAARLRSPSEDSAAAPRLRSPSEDSSAPAPAPERPAEEEETVLDLRRSATAERVVAALEPARRAARVRATLQSSTLARLPPPLLSLQLTSLDVSYCANLNVVAVDAIAAARTLRSLAARHVGSGLEALPASWAALSLARLDASENRLHRWPSALFKFPLDGAKTPLAASLVALDLSRNLLVDVPASVGCLGALEALDLRDNSLATVDDALFSSPPSLRRLDLSSNPNLVDLPPTVAAFVSRPGSSLLLRDNAQLRAPPSAVVAGGSDAVAKFYGTLSDADAALDRQRRRAYLARRDRELLRRLEAVEARANRRAADPRFAGDGARPPRTAAAAATPRRRASPSTAAASRRSRCSSSARPRPPTRSRPRRRARAAAAAAARARRRAARAASTPLASRKSSPALSPLTSRKSSPALSRTKKPRSARAIRRAASEPELASGPEPEATLGERRAAQARLDLEEARLALRRLGAGDDDGGEEIEILACFCLPKTIIVHKEGHPSDGKRVPLNANAQLELMREVTGLIEAVPSSQREIVPAARWPDDVVRALGVDAAGGPRGAAPRLLRPRIFHFSGHNANEAWWNAGGGSLLFQRDVSRGGGGRGGAFPETSAITPEPGEFVAVLERCGDNLELCFLNACASVAIARRIVHDLPNVKVLCWKTAVHDEAARFFAHAFYTYVGDRPCVDTQEAYDAAVAAFKQKYVVGNPHPWPRAGLERRPHGVPAMLRGRG